MTPEQILDKPALLLSQEQRRHYFGTGAIGLPGLVGEDWLQRCRNAIERLTEQSRGETKSGDVFDLEPDHSADNPRLRRINSPCDQDPVFWELLVDGPVGDLAADLLGGDVKFFQSKLNLKAAAGGTEVRWHQDAPFFPHTNAAVLTIGVYLEDCALEQGPLETLNRSHLGPLYTHYDQADQWRGEIRPTDCDRLDTGDRQVFGGPAGSVTAHNYRTVHGSKPNTGQRSRPLLLYVLSAADSMPYTAQPLKTQYQGYIVRGQMARRAHHEPGSIELPPDWSGGYTSIFALQQGGTAEAM